MNNGIDFPDMERDWENGNMDTLVTAMLDKTANNCLRLTEMKKVRGC